MLNIFSSPLISRFRKTKPATTSINKASVSHQIMKYSDFLPEADPIDRLKQTKKIGQTEHELLRTNILKAKSVVDEKDPDSWRGLRGMLKPLKKSSPKNWRSSGKKASKGHGAFDIFG